MTLKQRLTEKALELGFEDIGFTTAEPLDLYIKEIESRPEMYQWVKEGGLDLKQGAAVIPAAAMRARYGVPFADGLRANTPLESLLETPLESFPVFRGGCVVPIWFTVKVPAESPPGVYTGQATLEVRGEDTLEVPISLHVADYVAPDTPDYRTWIELMQSPDTLAMEYDVSLWSERHWELIAQSMRYIGEIGSRGKTGRAGADYRDYPLSLRFENTGCKVLISLVDEHLFHGGQIIGELFHHVLNRAFFFQLLDFLGG